MFSFDSAAALAAAPSTPSLDIDLRQLLSDRVQDWAATGLLDLTHLLVLTAGDTEQDLLKEIDFSPLLNPLDGSRFGSSSFTAPFDWLEAHPNWFELIATVGNSGFAFVLFLQRGNGADPDLMALCDYYMTSFSRE